MRWLCALLLVGCGGGVIQRVDALPAPSPGAGFVEVRCTPTDADVYVDGRYFGRLDGYPHGVIRLPAGQRRLRLAKKGFYPWYGVVQAGPEAVRIGTHLVPEP